MRKNVLFPFVFIIIAVFGCKNEETIEEPRPKYFYYKPSELVFSAKGGIDSVWSGNVVFIYRDDTTIVYGNSLRSLNKDTLSGNKLRFHGAWYDIDVSYTDSCFMRVTVLRNDSSAERHDHLFMNVGKFYKWPPFYNGDLIIRQEGEREHQERGKRIAFVR
ncbi:MAG: hypothetical protein J5506_01440 [Prevotella sp.]|nr:hypothetical protein [Prevotella sp.]